MGVDVEWKRQGTEAEKRVILDATSCRCAKGDGIQRELRQIVFVHLYWILGRDGCSS